MIKIITSPIPKEELKESAHETFESMTKAVVDVELGIMAAGGSLHADEEAVLLEQGSKQENLWGINIYFEKPKNEMVEFDSMINIRPKQNNRGRGVDSEEIRKKILAVVNRLIHE